MNAANAEEARTQAQAAYLEHQILDHLKKALRVTLDWQAPTVSLPRKMSSVQFTMKSFFRHLNRMMDLEERDGYMAAVVERNPNSDARVRRLQRDHASFRKTLDELKPEINAMTALTEEQFDAVCRQVADLLACVDLHDVNEIELLQETMLCDSGGEG
jgi:chromosome segregation ATPase